MTALHLGVSGGHIEVVEELASRADPSAINAVDKVSNFKIIYYVSLFSYFKFHIEILLNIQHGFTPLILATKLKNIKLIEVLHDHGADVNIKTKEVR